MSVPISFFVDHFSQHFAPTRCFVFGVIATMPPLASSSEIDDIFAGSKKSTKKSSTSDQPVASTSTRSSAATGPTTSTSSKKKKKKKTHVAASEIEATSQTEVEVPSKTPPTTAPKRVPETVLDPSLAIAHVSSSTSKHKRKLDVSKEDTDPDSSNKKSRRMAPIDDGEARFKDSRGTGPSTYHTSKVFCRKIDPCFL